MSPQALTFTAATWDAAQTVEVRALHDADAVADSSWTLGHAVTGGDYEGLFVPGVQVTIIEDDQAEVKLSETALTIEEGAVVSYAVVLSSEPTADVTVSVQVPDGAEVAVSPRALTFTAATWDAAQTVEVRAMHDADAVADSSRTLGHAVTGGDYEGLFVPGVQVTIIEDDQAEVRVSATEVTVEEGAVVSYAVVLSSEPTADVTVSVQVPDEAEVAVSPPALTFTAATWDVAQTVEVRAMHDADAVADSSRTLGHAVTGGDYEGLFVPGVQVTIIEDDQAEVRVSATEVTVEEGAVVSYAVVLSSEPTADVTVSVQVPAGAEIAVSPRALTFTAATWDVAQTVEVRAMHDADAVADSSRTLGHAVTGGDYEGLFVPAVQVTIIEDDRPALSIAGGTATEGDGEMIFTVTLSVASSLEVSVDWKTSNGTATAGADYEERSGSLRFDPLETEQTITVTLLEDALDEADETFTVTLANPANATLADGTATGLITDNDAAPALSIADAQAPEGAGKVAFTVTLGAASSLEVSVDWKTFDGTATAGADYTAAEGRLTFAPGHTAQSLTVALFNDALDEADETFTVTLANPANATLADGTATGTISDDDVSVEKAWLSRFGRNAAGHVVDALSDRLTDRAGQGAHLTVAGQRVALATGQRMERRPDMHGHRAAGARHDFGAMPASVSWPAATSPSPGGPYGHPSFHLSRSSAADLLSRSSFFLTAADPAEKPGPHWTAWGRGATTRFRHRDADLALSGGVVTGLFGVDRRQDRMLAGVALAHTQGSGEVRVRTAAPAAREVEPGSHLTSLHPYLRVALDQRLSAWGLLGYGRGRLTSVGGRPGSGIAMRMGGLGMRGSLLSPGRLDRFDLALKSDAFLVQMNADPADRPALETSSNRLRLTLEGTRAVRRASGRTLTPSLEIGMRRDGGDADTGLGLEIGSGLGFTDPQRHLTLEATARRLIVHQESGYEEWGVGGSLHLNPGASGRGLSLRLQSSWGPATSGVERLWSPRGAPGLAPSPLSSGTGFHAELGYGLGTLGNRGLITPFADMGKYGRGTRTYRLGGRFRVEPSLRLELAGGRHEHEAARPRHELRLIGTLRL